MVIHLHLTTKWSKLPQCKPIRFFLSFWGTGVPSCEALFSGTGIPSFWSTWVHLVKPHFWAIRFPLVKPHFWAPGFPFWGTRVPSWKASFWGTRFPSCDASFWGTGGSLLWSLIFLHRWFLLVKPHFQALVVPQFGAQVVPSCEAPLRGTHVLSCEDAQVKRDPCLGNLKLSLQLWTLGQQNNTFVYSICYG